MELVESSTEVIENAKEFSNIKNGNSIAFDRFTQFFHWYYFPEFGVFAPSKFIGYKNTTIASYTGQGNGGKTQVVLRKWFKKLDEGTQEYESVSTKLHEFSESVGKKLSTKVFNGSGGIYLISSKVNLSIYPDELPQENHLEGATKKVIINAIERNPAARKKCIEYYGPVCGACDFDFSSKYGSELGAGFIHVHHILDISLVGQEYKVDPIKDLRPLCPNCHAMVHRTKPAMHPNELRAIIEKNNQITYSI
ncbi:HNH endonuclease [Gammaproteobacteria bacterium AS21]